LYDNTGHFVVYSASIQNGDDQPWEALGYYATYIGAHGVAVFGDKVSVYFPRLKIK
jgi:hypothetical protein